MAQCLLEFILIDNFFNIGKADDYYSETTTDKIVKLYSTTDKPAVAILALYRYDEYGVKTLKYIDCQSVTADDYGTGNADDSLSNKHVAKIAFKNLPSYEELATGNYALEAFAWKDISSHKPFAKKSTILFVKE